MVSDLLTWLLVCNICYFSIKIGNNYGNYGCLSWVCLVGDLANIFPMVLIHHDWGIDEVNMWLIFWEPRTTISMGKSHYFYGKIPLQIQVITHSWEQSIDFLR